MLELITIAVFLWLGGKAVGLMLKLIWSAAKIIAGILMTLALPVLIVCLVFIGGIALIIPVAMLAIAVVIVKACV